RNRNLVVYGRGLLGPIILIGLSGGKTNDDPIAFACSLPMPSKRPWKISRPANPGRQIKLSSYSFMGSHFPIRR
ncbi:MAG TPA: hypothetical protein VF442_14375, partial [Sphingobium sp.]